MYNIQQSVGYVLTGVSCMFVKVIHLPNSIECNVQSLTRWEDRVVSYVMAGNAQKRELTGPDQLIL